MLDLPFIMEFLGSALLREHFEIHLITNTKRIKLRRFEVILTPDSTPS